MPSNPNQLVELKVAGRYRMLPVWATKLSFEVRPGLKFDSRAWKLWKPCLLLLEEIVKKEKLKVSWVRIHSHFGLKGDIPQCQGLKGRVATVVGLANSWVLVVRLL